MDVFGNTLVGLMETIDYSAELADKASKLVAVPHTKFVVGQSALS
jgi:hypothetical protein